MDNGIKAVWYDLDKGAKEGYLSWLHRSFLPELQSRPGYLWVAHYEIVSGTPHGKARNKNILDKSDAPSVGRGTEYLLLIGAASADIFFSLEENVFNKNQGDETREMLSQRQGSRVSVFIEETRVNGPELRARVPGTTPGPAIQMGSFVTVLPEDDFELGAWYRQSRLPAVTRTPGCIGARKLVSVAGWAKHSILYEFTSFGSFEARPGTGDEENDWTGRHVLSYVTHAPGSPSVGKRIWPKG
ncbi:MAG: hypothetical protein JRJ65_02110 [Deltaproteobacteria bacterium]|nr:hypothetical protein [Deltaproteobacteria bacterium]